MPEPDHPPSDSSLAFQTANTRSPTNRSVHQEHWPLKRIPIQPALSLSFLASILLIFLALVAIAQFVVFPDTNRWAPWCVAVYRATQGLIDFTLMLGLFLQVLIIGILVIGIGRLRPRELGLDIAKLPAGVAWTFAAWLAAQLVTLLICVVAGEPIGLNPAWSGQWLLILQFLMGLAFCGIYIRTGNLFLAIGLHALANNPGPLLTGGEFLVPPTLFS